MEPQKAIDPRAAPSACVDASAHVFALYETAARWSARLGRDPLPHTRKAETLRAFIQERLFDGETGFFHDERAIADPSLRRMAFEGMWPVVVGAAAPEQAARVIDENLLAPSRFCTAHPIATVGADDPQFELRMWRGPAWNSMTWWAARGCLRYDRPDAARRLLEAALDDSARWFERTGTVWEFWHPHGGDPRDLRRKPHTNNDRACRDYAGHNPLLAMARMWEALA